MEELSEGKGVMFFERRHTAEYSNALTMLWKSKRATDMLRLLPNISSNIHSMKLKLCLDYNPWLCPWISETVKKLPENCAQIWPSKGTLVPTFS